MISTVRLLMYYVLAVTLGLTVIGISTGEFNFLFFGKLSMIAAALFFVADKTGKRTLREMKELYEA